MMKNMINEKHLGETATKQQAMELIEKMSQAGFDVAYGDMPEWKFENSTERDAFNAAFESALFE